MSSKYFKIECKVCHTTHDARHLEAHGKLLGLSMGLIWFDCRCKSTLTYEFKKLPISVMADLLAKFSPDVK